MYVGDNIHDRGDVPPQMRLARALHRLHLAPKRCAFASSVSGLSIHCAPRLAIVPPPGSRYECILYGGFGTFDAMVELRATLNKSDWECIGSLSVTASSGRADGSRCLLKGERAFCPYVKMGSDPAHDLPQGLSLKST